MKIGPTVALWCYEMCYSGVTLVRVIGKITPNLPTFPQKEHHAIGLGEKLSPVRDYRRFER